MHTYHLDIYVGRTRNLYGAEISKNLVDFSLNRKTGKRRRNIDEMTFETFLFNRHGVVWPIDI